MTVTVSIPANIGNMLVYKYYVRRKHSEKDSDYECVLINNRYDEAANRHLYLDSIRRKSYGRCRVLGTSIKNRILLG